MTVWGGRRWRELVARHVFPGAPCSYCGKQAQTLDHVLPRSKFPDLTWALENLTPACYRCNRSKGDRLDWRPIDLVRPGDW
jgi:5-methylcytosine-specific restriction endonuclease McrA